MLTLITFPEGFGQPSVSPFCVKAMHLLKASGLPWQREDRNDPRKTPRAKLPVLRTPEGLVHDSDGIRRYLEGQGIDFMQGLAEEERAQSHLLIRLAEEHMYFILLLDRWEREKVWSKIRDEYFNEIPKFLRGLITSGLRKNLLKGMHAQGLGRLTWDERMARIEQDLQPISLMLSESSFLFGDTPTLADYSVGAILAGMRSTPVQTELSHRISEDAILNAYIDRLDQAMLRP